MRLPTRFTALVLIASFVASSPPPVGAAVTDTFRDEFNNISYSGDDGVGGSWSSPWWDSEDQDPLAGGIRVDSDAPIDFVLWFATAGSGEYAERTADLNAYDTATLSFDYRRRNTDPSFLFKVLASANGPAGPFTEVFAIGPGNDAVYVGSGDIPITAYKSSTTTIRFWYEATAGPGKDFYVDNVEISASAVNGPPVADATSGEPYVINEGDSVTFNGSASSDPELAPLTYAWDLDNDGNYGEPGEPTGAAALAATPLVSWATLQSFGIDDDGSYPIGLRVTDDASQSDTTTTTLTVDNTAPTIFATGAGSVDEGAVYTLNLSTVDPGNETILGWTINWGDGKTSTVGDVSSAAHVYLQSGFTRNITVSVTDGDGTFVPGDLLVSSLATDSLFRFDATTGAFVDEFADLDGLDNPIDVEIGPDGLVYASGFVSNDVTRYNATTGAFVDQFVTPGSGGLSFPSRMVFGPDGNLYVASFGTDAVLRFDGANGTFIDVFVAPGSGTLDQPDGIAFGPDGNLYVFSGANGRILRYSGSSGSFINTFAVVGGTGYGDLAFGPDSNLYLSSVSLNSVQRFDGSSGAKIDDFVLAGSGGINGADGMAFGPDGLLYVVGFNSNNVLRYDASSGVFVDEFVSAAAGINQPVNLVFTPSERVLVTANNPPVAVDDSGGTLEDTAATVDVLGNDSDPEGDGLSVDSVTQGSNGSVVNNGTDVTFDPSPDWNGTDTFTYTVTDGNGGFDSATVTVTVTAQPDPPDAVDDADNTSEDTPVTVDVLGNDSDPDLDVLAVNAVTQGTNGSVVNNGTDVTYDPDLGWSGIDTFTYTVADGNGGFDSAAVTITVAPANDPPSAVDDADTTPEDTAVTVDVLANDSDPEGDGLSVDSVTQGTKGSVVNNGTDVTYTPNLNSNGTDTFTYTATDGNGGFATAQVTVMVTAQPDPPDAVDDTETTVADSDVYVWVLANDSDPDLDALSVSSVTDGAHGTVTNHGFKVAYSPELGWTGIDTFTYTVTDGNGGFDTATVTVTVTPGNQPPAAVDDSAGTLEDTAVTVDVITNDSDPEGDGLSVASVTQGSNGSVVNNGTDVTYTPNFNWNGTDTFTYTVTDLKGGFDTARVTITVDPAPDDPVAVDDSTVIEGDTSEVIPVLANDSDPDGDSLTIAGVIDGTRGTVFNNGSDVTYVPEPGWSGIDTFTYTVTDGNGGFDSAVVTVEVTAGPNRPPVAADDNAVTDEDVPVTVAVLGNDSDPDENALTVTSVNQGAHGTVSSTAGAVTYTPEKDWSGIDSFSYTVSDGVGGTATAAVIVTVKPVNDAPVARDDYVTVQGSGMVSISVLANDSDADGDPLAVTTFTQGSHGVTVTDGNSVSYSPSSDWSGTDSFTYTVTDGHGGTDSAVVVVAVDAPNQAPVISVDGPSETGEGALLVVDISTSDPDGDQVTISAIDLPDWADLVEEEDGSARIVGTPGFDDGGSYEISISASDGQVTVTERLTVEVVDVNRPPEIEPIAFSGLNQDGSFTFTIRSSDPDGDRLTITADGLPSWATLTDDGNGRAVIRSGGVPNDAVGSFSVLVQVADGVHTATANLVRPITGLRGVRPPELTHQVFKFEDGDTLVATALKPRVASPDPPQVSLSPREGLMVAFGSAVETLRSQILPALILGMVMAWMLMIGVGRVKDEEEETA